MKYNPIDMRQLLLTITPGYKICFGCQILIQCEEYYFLCVMYVSLI